MPRRLVVALIAIASAVSLSADDRDQLKVGIQPDGRIVVPTNQILQPAGKQVAFPGRPVALLALDGGKTLVVKNMRDLTFIDVATAQVKETLPTPGRGSDRPGFSVVGLAEREGVIYASGADDHVRVARRGADGHYVWDEPLTLPGTPPGVTDPVRKRDDPHPAGMAVLDGKLLVTATRANAVHVFDLASRRLEQTVPVGVAPYTVLAVRADKAYVSNWGGDPPRPGEPQRLTSGSPVHVDPRTDVADRGSVSVLQKADEAWHCVKSIQVGLHPSGMTASRGGRFLYVANAASDTVSVIDTTTDRILETINCRPEARLPFGSGSNALALSPDGATLYVANGTNNCVAVVRLGRLSYASGVGPAQSAIAGLIPTGWYPGAVRVSPDGKHLYVANVKGHGALSQPRAKEKGHNSHDHLGTVSLIDVPAAAELARLTEQVNAGNRLTYSLAGLEKPRPGVKPVVVPERHGEPSVIEHVVYIIKENRTYDQVFGDMKEGNGDPKLCIFGETVTPNQHKLARDFVLLDNFYCSGVLSADGHSWVNTAYVTDYLEKAFGGFTRSYPDDGRDPLAFAPTGFLWDNALAHGKTIRNYGEAVAELAYTPKGTTWADMYRDFTTGARKIPINITINKPAIVPFTHPAYPYFPLTLPDVYRAELFLEDLKTFEQKGAMPQFVTMSLPCNHTEGTKPGWPTPRAMVADNDLALGRIVEGISKSKFWATTCIFVVEDDPQNGFDHVDGHRTVALAISPYTRRKAVDSTCYNQTGMVKSIELMLGLPPMNQMDLAATPMRNCFRADPDVTPYMHVANRVALDEMNKPLAQLDGKAREWAKKSLELNLDEGDAADEDTLNRIIWFSVRGEEPYPEDR
jgi:YVTN family beta-propeller protein